LRERAILFASRLRRSVTPAARVADAFATAFAAGFTASPPPRHVILITYYIVISRSIVYVPRREGEGLFRELNRAQKPATFRRAISTHYRGDILPRPIARTVCRIDITPIAVCCERAARRQYSYATHMSMPDYTRARNTRAMPLVFIFYEMPLSPHAPPLRCQHAATV